MKICLVAAPGGHLTEMIKLKNAFTMYNVFLVTYQDNFLNKPEGVEHVYFIKNILVNNVQVTRFKKIMLIILQMLILTIDELKIILKEKPDIVVSTGSEIAIPIFYISKILGKKTIYIESLCRIDTLSGTGKIVRPISDSFLVQWESLSKKHKKHKYHGSILSEKQACLKRDGKHTVNNKENFIFVTVGTAPFPRLVEIMDNISQELNEKTIMQIGNTEYKPINAKFFKFIENFEDIKRLNREARIVVCHSGVGSIVTALEENGNVIVFPRLNKFGEHIDNHQLEIANVLQEKHLVKIAHNYEELLYLLITSNENNDVKEATCISLKEANLVDYLASVITSYSEKGDSIYERY